MNHPNIVPVYSVGCERGVHYYSMQFIEGQPLDLAIHELRVWAGDASPVMTADALATTATRSTVAARVQTSSPTGVVESTIVAGEHGFSTARSVKSRVHVLTAAQLEIQAAQALHHAHEVGIVHRDIKPSNLLIDRQGKLWITDFGLARCQAGNNITMTGDLVGTVRYMSPEQASGKGHLVDHRSDVYSLGLTLYELLTLRYAFDATDRQALLQQIERDDPPSLRRFNPGIPVDLETIILKTVSKARDDRYDSAHDLAEDLQRFLEEKPTLATRPRLIDRGAKWAGRHRPLVATVLFVLLLAFVGTSIAALLISQEQRRTAQALAASTENYRQSQVNLRQAREVVDRFGMHLANRMTDVPGMELLRQSLLQETLHYYESFVEQSVNDPAVRFDLALSYSKIAGMRQQTGAYETALDAHSKATRIYAQLVEEQPDVARLRHDLAICHNNVGHLMLQRGKADDPKLAYHRALAIQRKLVAEHPEQDLHAGALATTLTNLGNLQRLTNEMSLSKTSYTEAVTLLERLTPEGTERDRYEGQLANSYNELSFLFGKDDLEKAESYNRKALDIHERLAAADPDGLKPIAELATCYNNRGAIFRRNRRIEDGQAAYEAAIKLQEQLVQRAPMTLQFQHELGVSYNNLGQLLAELSPDRAEAQFRRAESLFRQLVERGPTAPPKYQASLGGVLNNIGLLQENTRQLDKAAHAYAQAVEHQVQAYQEAPQLIEFRQLLSTTYVNYGRVLRKQGSPLAAAEIAILRKQLWKDVGERLYRVSKELGEAVAIMSEQDGIDAEARDHWKEATVTPLEEAFAAGYRHRESLVLDPSFRAVTQHPGFRELAELAEPCEVDAPRTGCDPAGAQISEFF